MEDVDVDGVGHDYGGCDANKDYEMTAASSHYVDAVNDFETFLNSTLSKDLSSEISNITLAEARAP